jgi:hypothetical protein
VSSVLHGGPIAAAPYPLHVAGGGPHVTDGARLQQNGSFGKRGVCAAYAAPLHPKNATWPKSALHPVVFDLLIRECWFG